MLEHLEIRNFALIENLSVDFSEGFNVITGETGSGKSLRAFHGKYRGDLSGRRIEIL